MINLIKNPKKNTIITKGNPSNINSEKNRLCFRPNVLISKYLEKKRYDKSKFINNAINFYIWLTTNPIQVLSMMKKQHPDEWQYVNRRKF